MKHLSSLLLEANKLFSPSVVIDQSYRYRQIRVILQKNHAEKVSLHMHVLYGDLTGGTNSLSFLIMKVRNVKHLHTVVTVPSQEHPAAPQIGLVVGEPRRGQVFEFLLCFLFLLDFHISF